MIRARTVSMTPEKEARYQNARQKALQIVETCDAILNKRITEARACKETNLKVNSFRRFCKIQNENSSPEDKVYLTEDDWGDWREDFLFQLTGERVAPPDDFDNIFDEVCKKYLAERQATILRMRLDGCYLEEIGKDFGLTRERIRQIEAKIYRILRKPSIRRRLELGDDYVKALEENKCAQAAYDLASEQAEATQKLMRAEGLNKLRSETTKLVKKTIALRNTISSDEGHVKFEMSRTPLEHLDFSVRSYNCLKRHFGYEHNIYPTAYDVSLLSIESLKGVRNLGQRSLHEIVDVMYKRFGVSFT